MDDRLHGERGRCRGPSTRQVLERHPRIRRDLELARSLGLTLHQFDRLSESERAYWIADRELKNLTCHECGNPIAECSDPQRAWYPHRTICYATMARGAFDAKYTALHEALPFHDGSFMSWAKDQSDEHPFRYDSGVSVYVSAHDVTPWDEFVEEECASPVRSVAEQAPGEQDEAAAEAD